MGESILDKYRKKMMEESSATADYSLPKDVNNNLGDIKLLSEDEQKAYAEELDKQRNSEYSMEAQYKKRMAAITKLTEDEMIEQGHIKPQDVSSIKVLHAYCTECGEELVSDTPTCFNAYTMEKISIHNCKKCGKKYNLEYAYPRVVFLDEDGNEIIAFNR